MRTVACVLAVTLGISNLVGMTVRFLSRRADYIATQTLRTRLTPSSTSISLFRFSALRSPAFAVYAITAFFTFLGSTTCKSTVWSDE